MSDDKGIEGIVERARIEVAGASYQMTDRDIARRAAELAVQETKKWCADTASVPMAQLRASLAAVTKERDEAKSLLGQAARAILYVWGLCVPENTEWTGDYAYAAEQMRTFIDSEMTKRASAESRLAIAVGCLEKLTTACEKDFCSPATATCTGAVGGGKDGDMAVTFEMIRESRSALAEVAIQKGKQ